MVSQQYTHTNTSLCVQKKSTRCGYLSFIYKSTDVCLLKYDVPVKHLDPGHERHPDRMDYTCSGSWSDLTTTSNFHCSQEQDKRPRGKTAATPGPRTAFFLSVVWIKWMNIFRPTYFTLRHLDRVGGHVAVWAKSPVERKH